MPDTLTLWSHAVFVIGGLMYAAMHMSTPSPRRSVHCGLEQGAQDPVHRLS
jgi:hypothetical protein